MSANEAAERRIGTGWLTGRPMTNEEALEIGDALAAERRATVDRIRAALDADEWYGKPNTPRGRLNAILDEEAAR